MCECVQDGGAEDFSLGGRSFVAGLAKTSRLFHGGCSEYGQWPDDPVRVPKTLKPNYATKRAAGTQTPDDNACSIIPLLPKSAG